MLADILIVNASARTMSDKAPRAEAIAVAANRIIFVGRMSDSDRHAGPDTRIIDAGGASVLPGFVEAHMHLFGGASSLDELDLQETDGFEALKAALLEHGRSQPDADVIVGRSVNYSILGEGTRPTRQDLDRIIPDRPVFLRSGDYHNAWVNTAALEMAGVLKGHDVGPGSQIVVGEDGQATGELQEFAAMQYVSARLTPPGRESLGLAGSEPEDISQEERQSDLALFKKGLSYCASLGITTIHNMDGNFYQCELLRDLEEAGELKCRIEVPYHFLPSEPVENIATADKMAQQYNSEMLWSGRVKMFMDGVLDAWTAVMVDDYADRQGERGTPLFTAEHFNAVSTEADRKGLQISVHAIGDGAVRMTLDGYEAAATANGKRDSRHRIEHIEVVHPADIDRFKEFGVIASMQPIHPPGNGCFPKEPTVHMIGKARWPYAYAWRTLKDAGAEVVFATDWPVSPLDPLLSIKHAMLREPWSENDPDQRLTMDETLAAYTSVGAYTCFKEDRFSRLEEGMLADIVILDGELPEHPDGSSLWPQVLMTLCDGAITYEAGVSN
ncbi:MAG: amidohydrolase [Rhizobiales bacterium]|nr:amidohydrolase [Hyphomicrobiales bacterium]